MGSSTTEEPSMIVIDEGDDFGLEEIEPALTSRHINNEKLASNIIFFVLSIISGLCALTTVIRTKSVRSQLFGVILVNLAVAVLIRAMIVTRDIEIEFRGGLGNFGTTGCFFYHIGSMLSGFVINASTLTIFLDCTFNLPQSRKAQIIGTGFIWVFSMIITMFVAYVPLKGPEVFGFHHNLCGSGLRWSYLAYELLSLAIYCIVPSIFTLVTLIRFCCTHKTNKATQGKKLPFVLSAMLYLILVLMVQALLYLVRNGFPYEVHLWLYVILECVRVSISMIWLFLIPDLRNKCLCREISDVDSIELLE